MKASEVLQRLDDAIIATDRGPERSYVGASSIGHACMAYLQMSLRGIPGETPPANALRIFELGHVLEEQIVKDLKSAGYTVLEVDPETDEQWEWTAFGGHLRAHADGIIRDGKEYPVLLEIKTMNDKKWTTFKSRGIKHSHEIYYSQMQLMMLLGEMRLGMMIAYNKNSSNYHVEMVEYNKEYAEMLIQKASMIIKQGFKNRIAEWAEDPNCRYCNRFNVCWNVSTAIPQTCKTCNHSKPVADQKWKCTKHNRIADEICDDYERFTAHGATTDRF